MTPAENIPCPFSGRLETLTPQLLRAVASEPTLYGALAAVAQGFVEIFGAEAASVRVLRADGRTLDLVSVCGRGVGNESPSIDLADRTPAARAVRKHSIQFVSSPPDALETKATRAPEARTDMLVSLPLFGDDRILGAVTGRFIVPLAPSDCEQLADLGQILGALIELGLVRTARSRQLESPQRDSRGESGFWRKSGD